VKINIKDARLACPELKDETHFLPLPLLVPIAEFDPADQCVGCGMSVGTEMLCDGKTRRILVDASKMFTKTFPQRAPSLADVNGRAVTAGDAVNQTRGQTSLGLNVSLEAVSLLLGHPQGKNAEHSTKERRRAKPRVTSSTSSRQEQHLQFSACRPRYSAARSPIPFCFWSFYVIPRLTSLRQSEAARSLFSR